MQILGLSAKFLLRSIFATLFIAVLISAHSADAHEQYPTAQKNYSNGNILGSILGFGIGHSINGNYADKGWKFTLGEALPILLVGSSFLFAYNAPGNYHNSNLGYVLLSIFVVLPLGLATFAGFKIWEIIDLLSTPVNIPLSSNKVAYLSPYGDSEALGLSLFF